MKLNSLAKKQFQTTREVGKVSYLFNVAGVVSGKLFRDLQPSDVKRLDIDIDNEVCKSTIVIDSDNINALMDLNI